MFITLLSLLRVNRKDYENLVEFCLTRYKILKKCLPLLIFAVDFEANNNYKLILKTSFILNTTIKVK